MAQTRAFRVLTWLQRPHGVLTRGALAVTGFLAVLVITGRLTLAREAAGQFWRDAIKLGAHRVHWYLTHGWTARFARRTPFFDPTTDMDSAAVTVLADWLGNSQNHRLARLYVLAAMVPDAADQAAVLDAYCATATTLVPALPAPNPTAKDAKDAHFTLADAKAALVAMNVLTPPWYIISGTFLGAVREGGFLSHDYDVDIGIHAEEFDESAFLDTVLAAPDLTLVNHSHHGALVQDGNRWQLITRPALYRVLHESGIGVDVFIHHLDGDLRWHGSAKHRWDNSEFALADYTISGLPVRGPADADRYLTENYGGWRIPVKSFNCSTGTPNVSFPHNLTSLAEHMRTAILMAGTASAEVARLVLVQEGYVQGDTFTLPWA